MILVDTSVWIDHFRRGNERLGALLADAAVLCHPVVIGEIACGNLEQRQLVLRLLGELPEARVAEQDELLQLVEARHLHGSGLGWIDAHLLGSALLTGCRLWSLDKPLAAAAAKLALAAP